MRIANALAWLAPGNERSLFIDAGRVGCPRRGDTDIEACFACRHMLRFIEGRGARLICDYPVENRLATFVRRSG